MIKPMLAATLEDVSQVKYPVIASPKLDGIRCLIVNGIPVSRKLKPIPNLYIQKKLKDLPEGLDGELMTVNPDGSYRNFNEIQGDVMREDGEPDFRYIVFDMMLDNTYINRIKHLELIVPKVARPPFHLLSHRLITTQAELLSAEQFWLQLGYEGVMLRSLDSPYKQGRSTMKEGYLLKLKRFHDSEAEVLGFEEKMHNANEAEKDNLGHTKRSHKKAGMQPTGMLGAFLVKDVKTGKEFKVGTGFDHEFAKEVWNNRDNYIGKYFTYTYQELSTYGIPRFPVFKGWRDQRDMGDSV